VCPADSPAKEKSQVYLRASWCARSINCSKGRLDRQNRKFAPILVITEAKNAFFFKCTRSGFVYQELRDCRKDSDSSRVESFCGKRDSVESSHHFSQRYPSRVRVTKNRDSSRVIDSSHTITAWNHSS